MQHSSFDDKSASYKANALLLPGNMPLPEVILTQIYVAI